MIISTIGSTSSTRDSGEEIRWRSLARRGMLHSECESFDYLRLAPGTEFALRGRQGTESVWFTVAGTGLVVESDPVSAGCTLKAGDLVLLPAGKDVRLVSGDSGLELLWLSVMPREVTQSLPIRRPVV
jgi:mannose-6-phosphate isomerase-like protein (cupin superfamily)